MISSSVKPGNADHPAIKEGKIPSCLKGSRSIVDKGRVGEREVGGWALLLFVEGEAGGVCCRSWAGLLGGVLGRLLASVSSAVMV